MSLRKPRPSSPSVPAEVLDVTAGFDELNLGRLALISGQKTVPPDLRQWQKQAMTPDGRPVIITCTVPEGQVVPHGLDNDFMVGLVNLCFDAGLPDGPFSVSAYGLLKASGFPDSAQYYRALEESIVRLNKASYTIDEGWFAAGPDQWTTQSFAQVSYLSYARSRSGVRGTNLVTVQLAPPVMESLRAGYIKPLDLNFYRSLSQPLVRAVYRQLDALHFDDTTASGLVRELRVPLMGWGSRLGLMSDRPDNIMRTLKPAHDELLDRKYVAAIEISGRGREKIIQYVFGLPPVGEFPELAALLTVRGVKQGAAVRLSTVFPERIELAVRRFDHYVKNSVRPINNKGGLLVTIIQSPEDYAELPGYSESEGQGNKSAGNVKASTAQSPNLAASRADDDDALMHRETEVRTDMQGQELVDWVLKHLTFLGVMKHFQLQERTKLADAVVSGRLNGQDLVQASIRALAHGPAALQAVVEDARLHF